MTDPKDRLAQALSDRYTLGDAVGMGGMATVYRAEDIKHGRTVALKVLRPELSSAMGTDRFPREIRLIASFNHPHILSLYDSGESDGFLYPGLGWRTSPLNQEPRTSGLWCRDVRPRPGS